jgi:hypothetical protein
MHRFAPLLYSIHRLLHILAVAWHHQGESGSIWVMWKYRSVWWYIIKCWLSGLCARVSWFRLLCFPAECNKFSWGHRAEREQGSGGTSPLVRGSAQFAKWVKPVLLLGGYGCIFHRTGNSAWLCQNFGISEGGSTPSQYVTVPHISLTHTHTHILSTCNSSWLTKKGHYWLIHNKHIYTSNLVAKRISTGVAETEMPARQNQCVSYITHAYHTFWPIVFCIIISCTLKKEYCSAHTIYHTSSF